VWQASECLLSLSKDILWYSYMCFAVRGLQVVAKGVTGTYSPPPSAFHFWGLLCALVLDAWLQRNRVRKRGRTVGTERKIKTSIPKPSSGAHGGCWPLATSFVGIQWLITFHVMLHVFENGNEEKKQKQGDRTCIPTDTIKPRGKRSVRDTHVRRLARLIRHVPLSFRQENQSTVHAKHWILWFRVCSVLVIRAFLNFFES
jgi:hypothetical protein